MANNRNSLYDPSGSLRIRKPHPHDVLSGRGGGINSHPGNKVFREWVRVRKEAYNLAVTKAEKAEVAHQVMNLVRNQQPPGRFLQRDPNSTSGCSLWVELDANRALAKTSQALREGAPQIRAAHREDVGWKVDRARKSKRKNRPSSTPSTASASTSSAPARGIKFSLAKTKTLVPATSVNKAIRALQDNVDEAKRLANQQPREPKTTISVPPPLMSNEDFEAKFARQPKRGKFFTNQDTTPTLTSVPVSLTSIPVTNSVPMPLPPTRDSANSLLRANSLALSDFSNSEMKDEDLNQDFVNPFDDEHEIECINPAPRSMGSSDVKKQDQQQQNSYTNGRSSSNQRYVSPGNASKHPNTQPLPLKANCFCSCDRGECICSDLADHFLHRMDGLQLYLREDQQGSEARNPHSSSRFVTDLSDLGDEPALLNADFGESMKTVWDAAHPDLTSPEVGDWFMPTLLLPRRNSSEALKRLLRSPLTPRSAPAKQRDTGRQ